MVCRARRWLLASERSEVNCSRRRLAKLNVLQALMGFKVDVVARTDWLVENMRNFGRYEKFLSRFSFQYDLMDLIRLYI